MELSAKQQQPNTVSHAASGNTKDTSVNTSSVTPNTMGTGTTSVPSADSNIVVDTAGCNSGITSRELAQESVEGRQQIFSRLTPSLKNRLGSSNCALVSLCHHIITDIVPQNLNNCRVVTLGVTVRVVKCAVYSKPNHVHSKMNYAYSRFNCIHVTSNCVT